MAHRSSSANNGVLDRALQGELPARSEAGLLADCDDLQRLMATAAELRDQGHGDVVSYSRKVFIPLTRLCRDVCHYCTFAQPPQRSHAAYLTPEEVLALARAGQRAGCKEALFTLGDKPELRYRVAADELARLGYDTTLSYLGAMADHVLQETGLLPHLNPGVMAPPELAPLRTVSASMGIMLETAAERLSQRGGPHFGSPDKHPSVRLATIAAAGEATRCLSRPGCLSASERPEPSVSPRSLRYATSTIATITCRNSSSRTSAPSRAREWRELASRPSTITCGPSPSRASCSGPRMTDSGAAESLGRRVVPPDRRRHQRLGRGVAGDARPRQSRKALARSGGARSAHGRSRQGADRAIGDPSALCDAIGALAGCAGVSPCAVRGRCRGLRASKGAGSPGPPNRLTPSSAGAPLHAR